MIQGDCRQLPLADESVDMIFTDPPYLESLLPCYQWLVTESMRVLKPKGFVLAMCGGMFLDRLFRIFMDSGLTYYWLYENGMTGSKSGVVWRGGNGGRGDMPISVRNKQIMAWSKGKSVSSQGTCSWYDGTGQDKRFHHWGQDVDSARYYIECFSKPNDLILDPFVGGGTTGVACRLAKRRFVGMDISLQAAITTAKRLHSVIVYDQTDMFTQPLMTEQHEVMKVDKPKRVRKKKEREGVLKDAKQE